MSLVYSAFYVSQGSGYWQEIEQGWDLGPVAPMLSAKWNKPVFEWKYTRAFPSGGAWTHSLTPQNAAAAMMPPPPTPSIPSSSTWPWVVGGIAALSLGYLVYRSRSKHK